MTIGRAVLSVLFISAGILHFVATAAYVKIMPPYLPFPLFLVYLSGVCETLGGLGLLVPFSHRVAAWGIVALLIAVLPANLQMALDAENWRKIPEWVLWARLPLQLPLIWWAWIYARR